MLNLSEKKKIIEEMRIQKFSKRQCDKVFDTRPMLNAPFLQHDFEVLFLLTIPDDIYPGRSFLLSLCRSQSSLLTECLIFDTESSKFLMKVDSTEKVIKHIDFRQNKILVLFFDRSKKFIQKFDQAQEKHLPVKCRIFNSIHCKFDC